MKTLTDIARVDKNLILLTADMGFGVLTEFARIFPQQFLNVGIAEQNMAGVATGLALEGKIPILYSITPFLLYRPFETIRNYIHHEQIPVKLIGSGRDRDYVHDGISHWSEEDRDLMKILSNIHAVWPKEKEEIPKLVKVMLKDNNPWYINLKR